MNPRTVAVLGAVGIAAVLAAAVGLVRQVGVKSYGYPTGLVVRAGGQLAVLMERRDPFLPSLKGRSERDMSYSYVLWLIPESGKGDPRLVPLARHVASGRRSVVPGVTGCTGTTLWVTIQDLEGIDLNTGDKVATPPPAAVARTPISQLLPPSQHPLEPFRASAVRLGPDRFAVLASESEVQKDLKPGSRLYDNPSATATLHDRALHEVTIQSGPIPRIDSARPVPGASRRNAAFLRAKPDGEAIRFSNPDGFLIVYEDGDPLARTCRFARIAVDGSMVWTVDTGIGRLSQFLPHENLPALTGQLPNALTEPVICVVDLSNGTCETRSLKGPSN